MTIRTFDTSVNSRLIMFIDKDRFAKFLGWDRESSLLQTWKSNDLRIL